MAVRALERSGLFDSRGYRLSVLEMLLWFASGYVQLASATLHSLTSCMAFRVWIWMILWKGLGSSRAQRNHFGIRACHRLPFRRRYCGLLRQHHSNGRGCNYYDILKRHSGVRGLCK